MPDNNTLAQKADIAQKAASRLAARMKRMGEEVPNKRLRAIDGSKLDPATKALYDEWRRAEADFEREAQDPSQPVLLSEEPDDSEDEADRHEAQVHYINNGIDNLLRDTERIEVTPERFEELRAKDASDTLLSQTGRIQVSVIDVGDNRKGVISGIVGGHGLTEVMLVNLVVDRADYPGITHPRVDPELGIENLDGLQISGASRRAWIVTGKRVAILSGDPLEAALNGDPTASSEDEPEEELRHSDPEIDVDTLASRMEASRETTAA